MRLKHSLQLVTPEAPLVVLIHGRAFDMTAMKVFERVIPGDVSRLYLQAPFEDPEGGYCWWNMFNGQSPDAGLGLLLNDLQDLKSGLGIDPSRIVGMGFSQGAAMLSGVLQQVPTAFNAVALLAGIVLEYEVGQQDLLSGDNEVSSLPEVLMIHGTLDERAPIDKARQGVEFLRARGYNVEFVEDEVGHKVGVQGMRSLKDWLRHQFGISDYSNCQQ